MINSSSQSDPARLDEISPEQEEKSFILLVGLPCVGKSTYVANNIDSSAFTILSTDEFVDQEVARRKQNGEYVTYRSIWDEYHPTARDLFSQALEDAIARRDNIIIDKTNLSRKARKSLIDAAKINDYIVDAVVFRAPPAEKHAALLEERGNRTGKIIPKAVIEALSSKYQRPVHEEGIVEIEDVYMFDDLIDEQTTDGISASSATGEESLNDMQSELYISTSTDTATTAATTQCSQADETQEDSSLTITASESEDEAPLLKPPVQSTLVTLDSTGSESPPIKEGGIDAVLSSKAQTSLPLMKESKALLKGAAFKDAVLDRKNFQEEQSSPPCIETAPHRVRL